MDSVAKDRLKDNDAPNYSADTKILHTLSSAAPPKDGCLAPRSLASPPLACLPPCQLHVRCKFAARNKKPKALRKHQNGKIKKRMLQKKVKTVRSKSRELEETSLVDLSCTERVFEQKLLQ